MLISATALTILAHVILLLHQCGPSVIITLGHKAPSCAIWCAIGPYQKPWSELRSASAVDPGAMEQWREIIDGRGPSSEVMNGIRNVLFM